jgi:hypothetical protein
MASTIAWRVLPRARIRSQSVCDAEAADAEGDGCATADVAAAATIEDAGPGIWRTGGTSEAFSELSRTASRDETACSFRFNGSATTTRDEACDNPGIAEEGTRAAADKMEMAGEGTSTHALDFGRDLGAAGMSFKMLASGEAFPTVSRSAARDAAGDRDAGAGATGAARYGPRTPEKTSARGA